MSDSKIGAWLGARQHPAERQRSRVLFSSGVRAGGCLGGFVQGDLLAGEVLELADEVAGVAFASGLAVVEAGP